MEFVYVVKRAELFDLHYPQGFLDARTNEAGRIEVDRYLERARKHGFFVERRHAEQDSSLKQLIPYIVIARNDEVLLLKRTKKGGDARLHDKFSLGVGGHINPPDAETGDVLEAATRREIDEEITIAGEYTIEALGFINDDATPVGSVHIGVANLARVSGEVKVRETDMLVARFVSIAELEQLANDPGIDFETWSRFLVPVLASLLRRV